MEKEFEEKDLLEQIERLKQDRKKAFGELNMFRQRYWESTVKLIICACGGQMDEKLYDMITDPGNMHNWFYDQVEASIAFGCDKNPQMAKLISKFEHSYSPNGVHSAKYDGDLYFVKDGIERREKKRQQRKERRKQQRKERKMREREAKFEAARARQPSNNTAN